MASARTPVIVFWHRRDLRVEDNAGLHQALLQARETGVGVMPLFIFDRTILDALQDRPDARVTFIHRELTRIAERYTAAGGRLEAHYGHPPEVWARVLEAYEVRAVFTNRDYEPYAQERDKAVNDLLQQRGIPFRGSRDHVVFEKGEVLTDGGKPYTVFTPYKRKWLSLLTPERLAPHSSETLLEHLLRDGLPTRIPTLAEMGFQGEPGIAIPPPVVSDALLAQYAEQRNFPGAPGTSRLGIHLRFGTLSLRALARRAQALSDTFLSELIWRDFYQQVLYHFPQVATQSLKPEYDTIRWRNDAAEFERWCLGQTGYPIVDAGMRELNETGFMHNRVRMIVASFLTKHLLMDWRWGEAYFARKLLDFELASNNGGWQWAAGSGCDAQPYFRIFNPYEQTRKFDPELSYIRRWVPEWEQLHYPRPVVEHTFARNRALEVYKAAVSKG